jgi:hypothetical protein
MDTLRRLAGLALLLTVVVFSLGCGNDTDQSTPEATVRTFAEALKEGNRDALDSIVEGSEDAKRFIGGMAEYMSSMQDFKEAVIAEWGEEGWSHFDKSGGGGMSMEFHPEKLDEMQVRTEGDTAFCTMGDASDEMKLVRKDGKWFIDASTMDVPEGEKVDNVLLVFERMGELIREKRKRIGEEGVTAKSLSEELGRDMMATMMGQ